jgi:hypothetical protein
MNVAFGIVGTRIIAEWPKHCPTCGLGQFTKIADDWEYDPVNTSVSVLDPRPHTFREALQQIAAIATEGYIATELDAFDQIRAIAEGAVPAIDPPPDTNGGPV